MYKNARMRAVEAEECDACSAQTHGASKQPEGSGELVIAWAWVMRTLWNRGQMPKIANSDGQTDGQTRSGIERLRL